MVEEGDDLLLFVNCDFLIAEVGWKIQVNDDLSWESTTT